MQSCSGAKAHFSTRKKVVNGKQNVDTNDKKMMRTYVILSLIIVHSQLFSAILGATDGQQRKNWLLMAACGWMPETAAVVSSKVSTRTLSDLVEKEPLNPKVRHFQSSS
jgi:hypothetical protein